ncbi:MAG TPA: acyloxyacyl hydrolase [Stellaceae bacterium]|nr:acyloxyacyl hydrolase [Stellaceae bacterium]
MSLSDLAKRAALAAVAVVAIAAARPAAAQLSLGSPGGPPRLELGAGAFDITPSKRRDAGTQGAFRAEYHFGDVLWVVSPFTGLDVTTRGGTYLYGGFGFDINFGPNWVLTPNGAAGWYQRGGGTPLGSWFEFRTGAELDYKFANQSRLGVAVHHMSNAGLTQVNPGEQSILLTYHMPLQ